MWLIKDPSGETQSAKTSWMNVLETVQLFNKWDKSIAFQRVIYSDKSKVQQVYKNLWVAFDGAGHQLMLDILDPNDPEAWTENLSAEVEMQKDREDITMVRIELNNGWYAVWEE